MAECFRSLPGTKSTVRRGQTQTRNRLTIQVAQNHQAVQGDSDPPARGLLLKPRTGEATFRSLSRRYIGRHGPAKPTEIDSDTACRKCGKWFKIKEASDVGA
jgi:hypothetical protein